MRLWILFTAFLVNFVLLFTACSDKDKNAGGTSEAENSIAISDKEIAGVTQKGPFTKGSIVTLYELNFGTLAQTGKSFIGKISDSTGSFSINKIELASQYALLQAEGYYLNEITGKVSASQIALNAISDLSERDKVNINLLTHLEYERADWLTNENEMTIKDAKVKADKEIFSAFGVEYTGDRFEDLDIFGNGNADAALLAISVIMHSGRSEGEFSLALANMAMDLEKDGKWDDAKAIAEAADNSFEADTAQIRKNMEAWNIAKTIPDFAPIVEYFWNDAFGLGRCTAKREGEIKPDSNSRSRYFEKDFICVKGHWYLFNQETHFYVDQVIYEKCGGEIYDLSTQKCVESVIKGICGDSTFDLKNEVCEKGVVKGVCGKELYNEETQFCSEDETVHDKCGGKTYDPFKQVCVGTELMGKCGDKAYDIVTQICDEGVIKVFCDIIKLTYDPETQYCRNGTTPTDLEDCAGTLYNPETQYCNSADEVADLSDCNGTLYKPEETFCSGDSTLYYLCGGDSYDPDVYACVGGVPVEDGSEYDALNNTLTDLRDGQVYKTTVIAPEGTDYSEVWMAENLNLVTENSLCGGGNETTEGDCSVYGRLYTWVAAVGKTEDECGVVKDEKRYDVYRKCNQGTGNIRGVCPKGWHLPSQSEWEEIITAVGGSGVAPKVMRSESGWGDENNDAFGFSALPAGNRHRGNDNVYYYGDKRSGAYFWSSTELEYNDNAQATSINISGFLFLNENDYKGNWLSVRCLKD